MKANSLLVISAVVALQTICRHVAAVERRGVCFDLVWISQNNVYSSCQDSTFVQKGCFIPSYKGGRNAIVNIGNIPTDDAAFIDFFLGSRFNCSIFAADPNAVDLVDHVAVYDNNCYLCPVEGVVEICIWPNARQVVLQDVMCIKREFTNKNENRKQTDNTTGFVEAVVAIDKNLADSEDTCSQRTDRKNVKLPANGIWSTWEWYKINGKQGHVCIKLNDIEYAGKMNYAKLEHRIGLYYLAVGYSKMTTSDRMYLNENFKFALSPIYILEKLRGCRRQYARLEFEMLRLFFEHGIHFDICDFTDNDE